MKLIDLTNKKIGKLTVLNRDNSKTIVYWNCLCECGNKVSVRGASLTCETPTQSCGCLKKTHFIDYTGYAFDNIEVIKYLGKDKSKNNIYNFKCFCGSIFTSQISDVRTGKIKSCGCLAPKKSMERYLKDPTKHCYNHLYCSYKSDAKSRNYAFELTLEEFKILIKSECYYCGTANSNSYVSDKKRKAGFNEPFLYNGIDRVDNELGYTKENCVTSCRHCNISKHTLTREYFIERAYKIVELDQKRKENDLKALRDTIAMKNNDSGGELY